MGFSFDLINLAWENCDSESEMVNTLLIWSGQLQQSQKTGIKQDEDSLIAFYQLESQENNQSTEFQIILPQQRMRVDGIPCGLKNVGNTCYFNSLMQIYFFNSQFVKNIMAFQPPEKNGDGNFIKSTYLVQKLQNLFARMIGSDKRYADPGEVFMFICDHLENPIPIKSQNDVGEFNHYFLSRIQEGLTQKEQQNNQIRDSQIESSSSSILKSRSSIIQHDDIVSQLFFCQVYTQIKFEQQGLPQIREKNELFNWIPLNIKDGNLYDSFERFVVNHLDDFKNDQSESVKAVQYHWISSPPQTLSFQLQRVQFLKEEGKSIKLNDEFTFDEEIYIDRILKQNQKIFLNILDQKKELNSQLMQIKMQQQINEYNDQKVIQNVIASTIQFIVMQNNGNQNHELDNEKIQQFHEQQMSFKQQQLQQQINEIEMQLQTIQNNYDDLKEYKYVLQSILMHIGSADCGHYYTYIKDFGLNKWFKFNDIVVQEVTKEKVFQDAFGKNKGENAYILIYTKANNMEQEMQSQMRNYRISSQSQYLQDIYGSFLNKKQREELNKENLQLQKEIGQHQLSLIEQLMESYQQRFNFINEQYTQISTSWQQVKLQPLIMLNYPIYIKSKMNLINQGDYENILKWVVIEQAFTDVNPDKQGVQGNNTQITNDLQNLILKKFIELNNPLELLSQKQINEKQQLLQEYRNYIQMASLASILFDKILSKNFISALSILHQLQLIVKQSNQIGYFHELVLYLQSLIPIIIISKMIPVQEIVNLQELELLQTYFAIQNLKYQIPTPISEIQIQIIMNAIYENHKEPQIQKFIDQFSNSNLNPKLVEQIDKISDDVITEQKQLSAHYDIYNWSLHQKSDILFDKLTTNGIDLKANFKKYIKIYKKAVVKKKTLMKEEIEALLA
ncbi:unnamed protein product (macronuclear) [Paramecium tetraurelia]|uniref:Ubiquitin carboxyl-terminal hydrolase n=1 Tax=Paramecium tetraurelia TaxID=5888 RepID=A0BG34_PARTE|nr:uncharacterized protein GSPATT00028536001 [Paramecium tetraurelia]CAK57501.1 unnamed protein product [Paramecium tetraurelia]|eukprot:XP_001424899.1 hypothetical protein (macronuclear) [Paramecium tetraurelia strain d4-2]